MEDKKYYLGLDIGVGSVGYAVTDESYNLVKKQGKHLWGSRLFKEAKDASSRRAARATRRRYKRRRARIIILRDLFKEEMNKVDPKFFARLDNSSLHPEDKPEGIHAPFILADEKSFVTKYKTIYHLRKAMLESDEKFDIRYVYLVIAHMIKYSGNFLHEGDIKNGGVDSDEILANFQAIDNGLIALAQEDDDGFKDDISTFDISKEQVNDLIKLFKEDLGLEDRLEKESIILGGKPKKTKLAILQLINGGKISIKSIFPRLSEENIDSEKGKIQADSETFETDITEFNLYDEEIEILVKSKSIHDSLVLDNLLKGYKSITDAMIAIYDDYKKDLNALRKYTSGLVKIGKMTPDERRNFFDGQTGVTYATFSGTTGHSRIPNRIIVPTRKDGKKFDIRKEFDELVQSLLGKAPFFFPQKIKDEINRVLASCEITKQTEKIAQILSVTAENEISAETKDLLYSELKNAKSADLKVLAAEIENLDSKMKIEEQNAWSHLSLRLKSGKFFAKQNNKTNGVFPNQLNKNDLRKILEKQGKFYPFLLSVDKGFPDHKKLEYKIVSLFCYRIPYYVGPLYTKKGEELNHWIRKYEGKEEERIYPWNFFDVVDTSASAKAFIDNLRNTCTYIKGEETMPKFSLLFQLYKVLNELNNLYINNRPFTKEEKLTLLSNLYLNPSKKVVKLSDIVNTMKVFHGNNSITVRTRTNKDEQKAKDFVKANLSSWIDCKNIFGKDFYKNKETLELAETTIKIITAFEDKTTRISQLEKLLTFEKAEAAAKLPYKGYAPISRRLIDGLKDEVANIQTGEIVKRSILELMLITPDNFMEIYDGGKYTFKNQVERINRENNKYQGEIGREELINDSYASPAIRRAIFQTFHIIDELKHILDIESFDKIFVECTRAPSSSKKTPPSRKKTIEKFIEAAAVKLKGEFDEAKIKGELESQSDQDLKSKHLFHYFMQLGHDVYTGQPIDINRLSTDYDIDHIIPQAKIKDDSFINTVLTLKTLNNPKQDQYPLPPGFITSDGVDWIKKLNGIRIAKMPLMPKEKMDRLLRSDPLTDQELLGFVNRQLVFTNQSVKAVCDILKIEEPSTKIIYSKAALVSDFRSFFSLPKVRDINHFHHANDAFLNIVVGNVYNQRFGERLTIERLNQLKVEEKEKFSIKTGAEALFKHVVKSRNFGETIWVPCRYENDGNKEIPLPNSTINLVRKTLQWSDPMITFGLFEQSGDFGFFNKIQYQKGSEATEGSYPLKKIPVGKNRIEWMKKYGSYTKLNTPYFSLVASQNKNKTSYSLEGIPEIVLAEFNPSEFEKCAEAYLSTQGLKNPQIIIPKIQIRTLIQLPNSKAKLALSGKSNDCLICINMSELRLDHEHLSYFKSIVKILGKNLPSGAKKDLDFYEKSNPDKIQDGKAKISKNENVEFFRYIASNVFNRKCYLDLPELGKKLSKFSSKEKEFENLPIISQANALYSMVQLLICGPAKENFKYLGNDIGKAVGIVRINKKLNPGAKLFIRSYTGFYEKTLFVVPEE